MTKNDNLLSIKRPNLRGSPQTRTSMFMLASIGLDSHTIPFKLLSYFGFVNCYLSHKESLEAHPDCIVMVFNPTGEAMQKFSTFYDVYREYPNFVEDYVLDYNLIVVVFKVRDKWKETLRYFKQSQYSKMSKAYADLLKAFDFNSGRTYYSREYKIINKDPKYKEQLEESLSNDKSPVIIDDSSELLSPLDLEQETFSYELLTTSKILTG